MNGVVVGLVAAADGSTAQASWDSALALALAGGAGAFLGTVVTLVVQIRRDRWVAGREDQRRREDVEREAMAARRAVRLTDYREVLVFLHSFRSDLREVDTSVAFSDGGAEEIQREWAKLAERREQLMATGARVDVVGSAALRDVFERLNGRSVYFIVPVPRRKIIEAPPDNANETVGAAGSRRTVGEIVALTPEERKEQVTHRISRVIVLVDEARSIIREELDLHD